MTTACFVNAADPTYHIKAFWDKSKICNLTMCVFRPVDEAGPGPVKSKYDALDFDTLLKEAQKSLHR